MKVGSNLISLASRAVLAGLFLYASLDKVWEPAQFARSTAQYDILPLFLVNAFSAWLAWLELWLGGLLLLGLWTRVVATWAGLLLAFFTVLMIYAGFTGAGLDCGCFPGQEGHAAGFTAALRDFLLLMPAIWLMRRPGTWLRLDKAYCLQQ